VNPDESAYCGMCGSKLAYSQYLTKKQSKENYRKKISDGELRDASGFGHQISMREILIFLGGSLLALVSGFIVWVITLIIKGGFGINWFTFAIYLLTLSFIWGAGSRMFLDSVRERKVSIGRGIGEGFRNILPVLFICIVLLIGVGLAAGIYWIWFIPVGILKSANLPLSTGYGEFMMGLWVVVAGLLLLIPALIWLPLLAQLAIFRVLDRRSPVWFAPIWAINQVVHYHWELFWLCLQQYFMHILGIVICYVGLIGTLPIAGVQNAAIYEWLRLNGDEPEDY
jgi:hypothetical protein